MKIKSILLIAGLFLALTSHSFAQAKPTVTPPVKPPVEKPIYHPDLNKRILLDVVFTVQQFNDYLVVSANGVAAVQETDKLTGAQITGMLKNYKLVQDSLTSRLNHFMVLDKEQWAADTGKVVKKRG